jgi:hypothetical protein
MTTATAVDSIIFILRLIVSLKIVQMTTAASATNNNIVATHFRRKSADLTHNEQRYV